MIFVKVVICVLIADLLSGFFHWLEDAYGREHWPIHGEPDHQADHPAPLSTRLLHATRLVQECRLAPGHRGRRAFSRLGC